MSRSAVHRRCLGLAFILLPLALTTYLYLNISGRVQRHFNVSLQIPSSMFYVEHVDVTNGSIDLRGYFYDSSKRIKVTRKSQISLIGLEKQRHLGKLEMYSKYKNGPKVLYTDCLELFENNEEAINETIELVSNMTFGSYSPTDYINMTKNCNNFTQIRRYIMDTLTKEEHEFPIAYSILTYTDIEQFERLLRAIYRPQNYVCVHVDQNSKLDFFKAVESIVDCFPNVFMAPKRVAVKWGEFSVLEPELICMKLLYEQSKLWKYFINLTGQEFPLKTNFEIVKILSAFKGANDIEGTIKRAKPKRWKGGGAIPHNITATKGSVHIVASRGYVEFILTNKKAQDLLTWVKKTEIPDETFFTTLNHNPHLKVPGSYTGIPEPSPLKPYLARFKNWGDYACAGYYLRGICIFGIGDLPVLSRREELFANKFIWNSKARVTFECMEELLYNRTLQNYLTGRTNLNITWYSTRDFVKHQIQ